MSSNILSIKKIRSRVITKEIANDTALRIMSFNIRWSGCDEDSENCWQFRKEYVASMIRFHHMDIIGLQEPFLDQIEDLERLLFEYNWFGLGLENGAEQGPINAIFFKKDRFEILEKDQFYLSQTPDIPSLSWESKYIRGVTWAKFRDIRTSKIFYIFNTHFDYHSEEARNESSKLLINQIQTIAKDHSYIVTGDFNLFPTLGGDGTLKILTKSNTLMDAHYKSVFPHHGPTGSWSGFKEPGQPGIKPDYIFVDKDVKVLSHGILPDTFDGKFPSDHLPVIAEVELI